MKGKEEAKREIGIAFAAFGGAQNLIRNSNRAQRDAKRSCCSPCPLFPRFPPFASPIASLLLPSLSSAASKSKRKPPHGVGTPDVTYLSICRKRMATRRAGMKRCWQSARRWATDFSKRQAVNLIPVVNLQKIRPNLYELFASFLTKTQ